MEHLFDGRSLFFYFLGESPPELEGVLAELAEVYDANVQFRRFSDTLTAGCGPGCGTESAGGCGGCLRLVRDRGRVWDEEKVTRRQGVRG